MSIHAASFRESTLVHPRVSQLVDIMDKNESLTFEILWDRSPRGEFWDEAAPHWGKWRRNAKGWRHFGAPTNSLLLANPHSFPVFFLNNNIEETPNQKPQEGLAGKLQL